MDSNKKNILLVAGAIVAGTIFYFGRKAWLKRKNNNEFFDSDEDQDVPPNSTNQGSTKPSTTPVSSNPFKTVAEVKAFQDWMDKQGKPWIKPIAPDTKWKFLRVGTPNVNGAGYGNWGANTSTAWNVFGKQYLTDSTNPVTQSGAVQIEEATAQAISTAGLSSLYNIFTTGNSGKFTPQPVSFVAGARPYLKSVVGNTEYYFFGDKTFGVWNKSNGSWIMKGKWSIAGDMVTAVSIYNFSTFSKQLSGSSVNPLYAVGKAKMDGITNDKAAFLSEKLKNSMSGAGTDMASFNDAMSGIKNQRQYAQVYETFGIKEGQTLDQWISGDLTEVSERTTWNSKNYPKTGLKLRTVVPLNIEIKSTSKGRVSLPF